MEPSRALYIAAAQESRAIYSHASEEIKSQLLLVDAENYQPSLAQAARRQIFSIVHSLNRELVAWSDGAIDRAYIKGEKTAKAALEILGKRPRRMKVIEGKQKVKDDLAVTLLRANLSILGVTDEYIAAVALASRTIEGARVTVTVKEFDYDDVEESVARAAKKIVRTREAVGSLTKKVKSYLKKYIGDDEFIKINGRRYSAKSYAEMVARTAMSEAQKQATLDLCRVYENDLVQWSDHGTICIDCGEYEGNIYSISGNHPKWPPLVESPPLHPNCEHSLLPTSDVALEVEQRWGHYQMPGELIGG